MRALLEVCAESERIIAWVEGTDQRRKIADSKPAEVIGGVRLIHSWLSI